MRSASPPYLLYTDASDVPERSPRFGVGAVLIENIPSGRALSYFSWSVPQSTVDRWLPKKSYMGQLELLAAPIALATWKSKLSGSRCLHFVDNDSASACLVRGYSPKADSCEIVGVYWLQASETKTDLYVDRVESKSNISDGPSRFDSSLMSYLKATPIEPIIPEALREHSISSWFEPLKPTSACSPAAL